MADDVRQHRVRGQAENGAWRRGRSRFEHGASADKPRRGGRSCVGGVSNPWCVGLTVPCVSLEYQSDSQRRSGGGGADAAASEQATGYSGERCGRKKEAKEAGL